MALKMTLTAVQPAAVTPDTTPHKVPVVSVQPLTETEALTQEYLNLYRAFEEIDGKNLLKRMEEIRKQLQSIANEYHDATEPVSFTCEQGTLQFSERRVETTVKDVALLLTHLGEKFGMDVALSCVKIGLTELKKILSELEMEPFIEKKDGSRILKTVELKDAVLHG